MKIEEVFHMVRGDGDTSYANNSKIPEKAILETKSLMEKAIKEICNTLLPEKFVGVDLGCSSGPNALLVLSMLINSIDELYNPLNQRKPEIQFFFNDLPGNDFNNIFQLSKLYKEQVKQEKGNTFVSFYIAGLPGSFYGRLFPLKSVHFFHSSFSLMWLSQVPKGLLGDTCTELNKGNIYINDEGSPMVAHLYLEQFKRDFALFLKCRSIELIFEGRMILLILGRANTPFYTGGIMHLWGLLSEALNAMVSEGLVEEAELNCFNLPFYTPSMEEVKSIIEMEGSFHVIHAQTFECNWDPFDESIDDFTVDMDLSGENVAKYIRAVVEPLLASHFGSEIMKDLFSRFAKNIARHMSKGKPKHFVLIIILKLNEEVPKMESTMESIVVVA
ncbi:Monomethylxanthine methyltransferase 2 [Platanthera guangdongensis]|uniref:Monomethylxanthine methyltransferase 2 n=1 Tax=Platanthera guangdongensis TaxID=2320717 RepID=A0ABR2MGE7_9ASPA